MYKTYYAIQSHEGDLLKFEYDNKFESTYVDEYEMDIWGVGNSLFESKDEAENTLKDMVDDYSYDIPDEVRENIKDFKVVEVQVLFDIKIK